MTGRFEVVREAWFGADTYAGGTDKLGHACSNHVGTRVLSWAFEIGYNTRGFEGTGDRSRHLYVGVSIDLAALIGGGSRPARAAQRVLEFVQVPGTAALADRRL